MTLFQAALYIFCIVLVINIKQFPIIYTNFVLLVINFFYKKILNYVSDKYKETQTQIIFRVHHPAINNKFCPAGISIAISTRFY